MKSIEDAAFLEKAVAEIDKNAIEDEMRRIPAAMGYANALYSDAHEAQLRATLERKRIESRVYLTHRALLEGGGAKFSEASLKAKVQIDPDWVEAMENELVADAEAKRLQNICFVLQAKKDMLVAIGNRINAELRRDPLAAAQAQGHRQGQT